MKRLDFLKKLKEEGKLEQVKPSKNISDSYMKKSKNYLLAAKLLIKNGFYENAISECYYAMYYSVISLFWKHGIKCDNHTGVSIILDNFFKQGKLSRILKRQRKERNHYQYYIDEKQIKEIAMDKILIVEDFILDVRMVEDDVREKVLSVLGQD